MITCQYCGASYQEFQTRCSGCGATLPPKRDAKSKMELQPPIPARIRQICEAYEDAKEFRPAEALPESKLRAAEKIFTVFPKGKEIFLFCDTHPLEKGKRGFMICEDGLYWHNNWAVDTNRNYLTWDDFAKREIHLKGFGLQLGRGDAIGLSGLGSDVKREKALNLLTEIKKALTE
jgi:hypothetical protein